MSWLSHNWTSRSKKNHWVGQSLLLMAVHGKFHHKYVEGCDKCQCYRKDPTVQIHPQEVPEGPWQLVGVNLISPLPMPKRKDMILNIIDHYTKQIHLFPVTSQITADGIAGIYFDFVFLLHEIPWKIVSDWGPQFDARSMCSLYINDLG